MTLKMCAFIQMSVVGWMTGDLESENYIHGERAKDKIVTLSHKRVQMHIKGKKKNIPLT